MIICQSIRNVLDRTQAHATGRPRLLGTLAVTALTMMLSLGTVSPAMARGGDNDDDGLGNGDENRYGTNRTVADTDGDGLLDGYEVFDSFTNPTLWDTDHDGLSDGEEEAKGTNPLLQDSDGDLLSDYVEVHVYFTNPLNRDSDSDYLSDYTEVITVGTNPLKWDTDGDNVGDTWDRYPLDPLRQYA